MFGAAPKPAAPMFGAVPAAPFGASTAGFPQQPAQSLPQENVSATTKYEALPPNIQQNVQELEYSYSILIGRKFIQARIAEFNSIHLPSVPIAQETGEKAVYMTQRISTLSLLLERDLAQANSLKTRISGIYALFLIVSLVKPN
jgi:hypothetical protein